MHTHNILADGISSRFNRSDNYLDTLLVLSASYRPILLLLLRQHFGISPPGPNLKAHPVPNVFSSQKAIESLKMLGELPFPWQ